MTKLRNKLVFVILALCIVACLGLVVACGDDTSEDKSVAYTVTVTAGDAAAEGVTVTVKKGSAILGTPKKTDKDGKAVFKLAKADGYTVVLANLPEGYELPEGATLEFDANRNLVVALSEKFAYTVKLVNPDGTAFTAEGVTVGICTLEGNCLNPVALGADGIVKIEAEKSDYHVQILGLPAGYVYESDDHGYAAYQSKEGTYIWEGKENTYYNLTASVVEQTITIRQVNVIALTDSAKLSAEQINAYKNNGINVAGANVYGMEIKVPAKTTVYYVYNAEYSGNYCLSATNPNLGYKLNPVFLLGDTVWSGNGIIRAEERMTKGKPYYINVTNSGEEEATVTLILGTPVADILTVNSVPAGETGITLDATVYAPGANAVMELNPPKGTAYKLTVEGAGAIKQAVYPKTPDDIEFVEADYTASKACEVKYTEDMTGTLYFAVSVKADKYPAAVKVKIVKTGDNKNTTTVVENAAIKQAPAPEQGKKLLSVSAEVAATLVKGDDGYYHIGDKNGDLVFVVLTKSVGKYTNGIIYTEEVKGVTPMPYVIDVTSAADKAAANKGNTYKDYRNVLRGFDEYKVVAAQGSDTIKLVKPDITVEKYYANFVNSDGAYPLDDVLKEFLIGAAATLGNDWCFACYYYGVQQNDPIVGEYVTEDNIFTLTIDENGTFTVYDVEGDVAVETGTWSKSGSTYSFVCDNAALMNSSLVYANGQFTYSDDYGAPVTFEKSAK